MAVLKCTVCGGELEVNPDLSVGICKYCESTITIPKELDRKGNLYNRAVFLRQNNEFDRAVTAYEDILKDDNTDAEAHWGLVLSKYGIEYVADPHSGERLPTCHRTHSESILSDADYLAAFDYADVEAKKVYEMEALRINEIQIKILEISRKEAPYEIFICYKETDETGNRTKDSTLAQDLYYELTKKGYKVFFARKTLESKLGIEYEPIIFAALSSARIMIVLGTRPEHFNAVWVRNEWSRFSKLAKNSNKVIIPAYRDMSPYELPAELSPLQSQDMSKIGFMQDLIDGIERIMKSGGMHRNREPEASVFSSTSHERLIKNSETYLKLNNYSSAEEVYTRVTKEYPEDYRGWWGLIICKTRSFSSVLNDQSTLNVWFGYVKQLADPNEFSEVEKLYVDYLMKVADVATTEDMKLTNLQISMYNKRMQEIQLQIDETEKNKIDSTLKFGDTFREDDRRILDIEKELSAEEKNYSAFKVRRVIGIIMLIIGVLILFLIKDGVLFGVTAGAVGLLIYLSAGWDGDSKHKSADYERIVTDKKTLLLNQEEAKRRNKSNYEQDIINHNKKIETLKQEMSSFQVKIEYCIQYLESGKERISGLFFAQKCKEIGVQKAYDESIEILRNTAFGITPQKEVEVLNITCPACGESINIDESYAANNASVNCSACGNSIELKVVNEDHYSVYGVLALQNGNIPGTTPRRSHRSLAKRL